MENTFSNRILKSYFHVTFSESLPLNLEKLNVNLVENTFSRHILETHSPECFILSLDKLNALRM